MKYRSLAAFIGALAITQLSACGSGNQNSSPTAAAFDPSLLTSVNQLKRWQLEIDQFGGGLRPTGSDAEQGYVAHLAKQLQDMGLQVAQEPYGFRKWVPTVTSLSIGVSGALANVPIASMIPQAGITGPQPVVGQMIYVPGLSAIDASSVVVQALHQQNPTGGLSDLQAMVATLAGALGTGGGILAALSAQDVRGKIVIFDVPRPTIPVGALTSIALHVNDSNGTLGPTTPYSRPFLDMLFVPEILSALQAAGAVGAIGVLDYPAAAAHGTFHPFFLPSQSWSTVPGVYVDRDTGAMLKDKLASTSPVTAALTSDAESSDTSSNNLVAVLPGASPLELILSSHTDGTNSIEDNGPAALLAIADYFSKIPQSQRLRTLKFVFTGGHFVASAGIQTYCKAHLAELATNTLGAIEIEHIGAREWQELSPGATGLTGLNEPQIIISPLTQAWINAGSIFADQFDRSVVLPLDFPFGEGQYYRNLGQIPLLQYITGPVYLLNYDIPEVSTQFTDFDLAHAQVSQFIKTVLQLSSESAQALRPELVTSN